MNDQPKTGTIGLHSWRDFTKVMKIMGAGKWIYRGHEDVDIRGMNLIKTACFFSLLLHAFTSFALTEIVDGVEWWYNVANGDACVTGVSRLPSGVVDIPSTLGGYKVTSIGADVFYGRSIKSLTIPGSVTNVDVCAFGAYFEGDEEPTLTCVRIPQYVCDHFSDVFGFVFPKEVVIQDGVTHVLDSAFENAHYLSDVTIPNSVTNIGNYAFYGCGVTNMVIPDGVKTIGVRTFSNCSLLTSVTIGNDLTELGSMAFANCGNLASFSVSEGNLRYKSDQGLLLTKDGSVLKNGINGDVVIPHGVTSIEDSAFQGCSNLTSLEIPDSVSSVGNLAFHFCESLANVRLSENVTNIGHSAFYNCTTLTNIVIPNHVKTIGSNAFCKCGSLSGSLAIPDSVTSVGYGAFQDCSGIRDITIGKGLTDIGWQAFASCGITSVTIPASVEQIQNRAFSNCKGLASVIFEGNSPLIGGGFYFGGLDSSVFSGVASSCCAYVCHASAGWGVTIPGKWNGISIAYSDCMVVFDANGGQGGTSNILNFGEAIAVPLVSREGYTFNGWMPDVATIAPSNDVTYTAQWTPIRYMVTFDANGGVGGTSANQDYGTAIATPTVTRTGYTFKGWSPAVPATVPLGGATYTAQWEVNRYTVTFDANGGEGGTSQELEYGTALSFPPVSRSNRVFAGWFTAADGGEEVLEGTVVTCDTMLYAHWDEIWLCGDDEEGVVAITGVSAGAMPTGDLTIPATIEGRAVTAIAEHAFDGYTGLTSVTILGNDTRIASGAFYGCTGLTNVTIGSVGEAVSSATSSGQGRFHIAYRSGIGDYAFYGCVNLEKVAIVGANASYIGGYAFNGCARLVEVAIDTPEFIGSIGEFAFKDCPMLDRFIFGGDTYEPSLGIGVFEGVPSNCRVYIRHASASGWGNAIVYSWGGVLIDYIDHVVTFDANGGTGGKSIVLDVGDEIVAPVVTRDGYLFNGWSPAVAATMPTNDVTYAAQWVQNVFTITFDANGGVGGTTNVLERGIAIVAPTVTRTGYTFTGWTPDVAATVPPSNVTYTAQWEINRYIVTFDANGGVGETNLVFEHGMPLVTPEVTRTNYDFRCWCRSANGGAVWRDGMSVTSDMTLYAQWTLQPNVWFYDVEDGKARITRYSTPTGDIIVPAEIDGYPVTAIAASVFSYRTGLTSVTIPDGVTSIDDESFRNCSALTNVWIGSGVMYIGTNAFRDCYALLNVEIGGGVEVIGNSAFRGCSRLSDITIPAGVNTIENYAFAECNSLEDVTIPDSVGFIGPSAFSSCGGLTNVTIGTGVTRIGSYAFRYCSRLITVLFEGKCPSNIGNSVFGGVSSECCAYIHRASRGWGTVIPRSWNGITLDYIRHDVFFVANGGTCDVTSVSVADGSSIGMLPAPVLTNAVFLGWFTSANGGSRMDEAMIVTQSTTLYAHWLPQTLDEAMDVDVSVRLATSEVNPWMPVFDSTAKVGDTTARSGAIGDKTNTWITATVSGVGTMSFWLKTSCEHDDDENALTADRLMVYTNGVEIVEWRMDGETDWTRREVSFAGGENTVKWVYYKDKSGVGGEDCAWVDGVMWTLTDPIPPIVSDSEVLTALAGTTDVNLTANVTNAAQYTAYRAWALSVTNDTTTAQMVKESTRTWLSYAFAADALIDKELTSDDVKIESFTPASTDGKFEFTVSVKDVNIGGGSVAVETLKENLKKVLGIEGSATLSPGGFSSDNIDITFDTPVDGKARFIVSPPADAGNSFFMRVKVK